MALPADNNSVPEQNATPSVPGAGLPAAMNQAQILDAATKEVNSAVGAQIDPLQNQIGTLGGQQTRAIGAIGDMFAGLQPTVDAGVKAVSDSFAGAEKTQNDIFTAAQANMNKLKQDRAQEAQRMAQEIGGPVAVGEFTAGFDPASEALINLGAGSQLHTLGYAQAGVQEAGAFAREVFPLLKTESQAQARGYYEDQIKTIQGQIDNLNASKTGLINSRVTELQQQQLQYQLQKNQQALDQLNAKRTYDLQVKSAKLDQVKANHDWQATLRTLRNDEQRIALSKKQFALDEGKTTGTYKNKPTVESQTLSFEDKKLMKTLDIDRQTLDLRKQQLNKSTSLALKKLRADQKVTWNQYVDAGVSGQVGKSVTTSIIKEIPTATALTDMKGAFKGDGSTAPDGTYLDPNKTYRAVTIHQAIDQPPISDPNELYQYLRSNGVPATFAKNAVKSRLHLPEWKPGQKTGYDVAVDIAGALP